MEQGHDSPFYSSRVFFYICFHNHSELRFDSQQYAAKVQTAFISDKNVEMTKTKQETFWTWTEGKMYLGELDWSSYIQGIHKRMVQFQKLTKNLFLTLHGHNVHRQQRQLSKFFMRYQ